MNPQNSLGYEIQELLLKRNYAVLEQRLNLLHRDFIQKKLPEQTFANAFEAFTDRFQAELGQPLEEWVSAYPDSYVARLARSQFMYVQGHDKRGFDRAHKVELEQWQQMYDFFNVAFEDAFYSLQLSEKPTLTYVNLMRLESTSGGLEQIQTYYKEGIEKHADSLLLRRRMLLCLRPEWQGGGDFAMMDAFLAAPEQRGLPESSQRELQGIRFLAQGHWLTAFQNNETEGMLMYKRGLELSLNAIDCERYGFLLFQKARFREAVEVFEKGFALTDYPDPFLPALIVSRLMVDIGDKRARVLTEQGIENGIDGLSEVQNNLKNPGFMLVRLRAFLGVVHLALKFPQKNN